MPKEDITQQLVNLLTKNKPKIRAEKNGFSVGGIKYKIPTTNTIKKNNPTLFR